MMGEPQLAEAPLAVIEQVTRLADRPRARARAREHRRRAPRGQRSPDARRRRRARHRDGAGVRLARRAAVRRCSPNRRRRTRASARCCSTPAHCTMSAPTGCGWRRPAAGPRSACRPLRVDLAGIGESEGATTGYADVAAFYVPDFVEQIRAVLDALQARGLPPRFVLLGPLLRRLLELPDRARRRARVGGVHAQPARADLGSGHRGAPARSRRLNRLWRGLELEEAPALARAG